jgi:sulfur carrier protein ThiS
MGMAEPIRVTVTARGLAGSAGDPVEKGLPSGSTVATVLGLVLAANPGLDQDTDREIFRNVIVTVNGRYVPVSQVEQTLLAAGDQITVMPLVVGG